MVSLLRWFYQLKNPSISSLFTFCLAFLVITLFHDHPAISLLLAASDNSFPSLTTPRPSYIRRLQCLPPSLSIRHHWQLRVSITVKVNSLVPVLDSFHVKYILATTSRMWYSLKSCRNWFWNGISFLEFKFEFWCKKITMENNTRDKKLWPRSK